MSFHAEGTSVLRSLGDGENVGVAFAFDPDMASRIADALNASSTTDGLRAVKDPLTGEMVERLDVHDERPLSDVIDSGSYVKIVGPYATAKMSAADGGRQVRSLASGSVLPGDVTAGQARHLIDVGLAQLVEAASAADVFEAAPTERQRVEMASPEVTRPTVGAPTPGSPADAYDRDPIAAARAAARTAPTGVVGQTTGAGESFGAGPAAAGGGNGDKPPAGNASRDDWVAWAAEHGASEDELAPTDQGGLTRDELRARYGS